MFNCGPAIFCPVMATLFSGGLFYCDFNDGTSTDQVAPAAPFAYAGDGAISVFAGRFKPSNTNSVGATVTWAAAKFAALTTWTIECVATWNSTPNSTNSFLMRIVGATGNNVLGFYATGGDLAMNNTNIGHPLAAGTPTHLALGSDGNLWVGGYGPFAVPLATGIGTISSLSLGPQTFQGARDYSVDWFLASVGIKYTVPFTPPGPA